MVKFQTLLTTLTKTVQEQVQLQIALLVAGMVHSKTAWLATQGTLSTVPKLHVLLQVP